jgi:two-component system, OmpR family, sensor histidine kinase CiaH
MKISAKKRLFIASTVYWFLLVYIIAALVLWYYTLEKQNTRMTQLRLAELRKDDPAFEKTYEQIMSQKKRNTTQYVSEGLTFLAVTIVAALFVYQAVRRQVRLQHQQENFMMAVTHELKTPMAIAKLNLETLQKYHLEEEKKQKLLLMTLQEINRLDTLANNILVSSQLDAGRYRSPREELNFSDLVNSSVEDFKNRYPNRQWSALVEQEADVTGDALLLQILVNNLLENAVKYSPREGKIECRLVMTNHTIQLQVIDEGPGIPDNEKKKVFDKFYRIGNEATRTTKGTGLGLYLCKKIVEEHRGTIQVADNSPSGCNFTVSFFT